MEKVEGNTNEENWIKERPWTKTKRDGYRDDDNRLNDNCQGVNCPGDKCPTIQMILEDNHSKTLSLSICN